MSNKILMTLAAKNAARICRHCGKPLMHHSGFDRCAGGVTQFEEGVLETKALAAVLREGEKS